MDFELLTDGTITDVPDFWAGSAHCGLKTRSKRDDICIIYTPLDTVASAVFTTNLFAAAPVIVCREQLQKGRNIKAVVVNAGNATSPSSPSMAETPLTWQISSTPFSLNKSVMSIEAYCRISANSLPGCGL